MITTRKLNQVRNSFYVYLPRTWCDRYSLTKESEVKIQVTPEGTLLIMPPDFETKSTTKISFLIDEKTKDSIESILIGAYIVGAGGIDIEFAGDLDLGTRETISKWIRRLPGFEILDEHSDSLMIADTSEKQVVIPILRRQFSTTKYMLNGMIKAMNTGEFAETSRIVDRDEDVDRHRYFVERLCHLALQDPAYARKISITPPECLHFSLAAKYIERVADHVCGATNELENIDKLDTSIVKIAERLSRVYEETMKTFFSVDSRKASTDQITTDTKEAIDVLKKANTLSGKLAKYESSRKQIGSHTVVLGLHLERIASYCADIGEVAINRIIESRISSRVDKE